MYERGEEGDEYRISDSFEDLGVDVKIILKSRLKKMERTRFIQLSTRHK
jgi:hypothetical protein